MPTILSCGHPITDHGPNITGYARTPDTNEKICYDCAAAAELKDMLETGRGFMYVGTMPGDGYPDYAPANEVYCVHNWTGRNKIRIGGVRAGHHNMAGYQIHSYFRYAGALWHGIQWHDRPRLSTGLYCRVYRTKQLVTEVYCVPGARMRARMGI